MQIAAPAKINLNLRVIGRNDATGFHDIETWMLPLTLADEISINLTSSSGITLACSDPDLDNGSGNLAWKAAELFLREAGLRGGAAIELHKRIPHGAGLGGGSSDAAAVLKALNTLCGAPFDDSRLEALGAQLGSDVPFFIRGKAAMARGRGERLDPRPLPSPLNLLLLKPPFPVPTGWTYDTYAQNLHGLSEWSAPQMYDGLEIFNDLERPVFRKYLMLPAMKQWLLEHSLVAAASMTGSGSCLFAILRDPRGADQLAIDAMAEFGGTLWTASCRAE